MARVGGIVHRQHKVRAGKFVPGTLDTQPLDFIAGIAQAGGIHQVERNPVDLDGFAQRVARGARNRRDDRPLHAREPIEQAGLADIGPASEHHLDPGPQQASLAAACQNLLERGAQTRQARGGIVAMQRVHVLLGEIERCLGQRPQLDQLRNQSIDRAGEFSCQRAKGAARRFRAGCIDQIRNRFSLRQVHAPVEESAARELPGLGESRSRLHAGGED
jgi:hypothetical protein